MILEQRRKKELAEKKCTKANAKNLIALKHRRSSKAKRKKFKYFKTQFFVLANFFLMLLNGEIWLSC